MKKLALFIVILTLATSCVKSKYKKNCCTGSISILAEGYSNTDSVYLVAPNAFTPNADGINDVFALIMKGIDSTSFTLVISQGDSFINDEEVFNSNDDGFIWDGTNNGKKVRPGVYSYEFSALTYNSEYIYGEGELCLIEYDYTTGIKNCSSCYFSDQFDPSTHTFTLSTSETYCNQ